MSSQEHSMKLFNRENDRTNLIGLKSLRTNEVFCFIGNFFEITFKLLPQIVARKGVYYDIILKRSFAMNSEITMSVSSLTRTKDDKAIYVLFTDKERSAEISLPELKVLSNNGFSADELKKLTEYVDGQRDYIYSIAKKVDPMKAFMGKKQGE